MGNCCCPQSDENQALNNGNRRTQGAFQGEGHRLGTANEANFHDSNGAPTAITRDDNVPKPIVDQNLTDDEREKIRNDRAAAAEARLKKMGGGTTKPKKKVPSDAPLRGPNSKPTMTWTAG